MAFFLSYLLIYVTRCNASTNEELVERCDGGLIATAVPLRKIWNLEGINTWRVR